VLLVFLILAFTSFIEAPPSYLPAQIENLSISPQGGVVTLKTQKGHLPIYISYTQAIGLRDALNRTRHFRPTTHDIAAELAKYAKAKALYITKLVNGTYYAELETSYGKIDIRPSDGLIICTKVKCPIYVNPLLNEFTK